MDEFDYGIFRYLSPDGQIRFWGSRRLIDPRVSAREIAEKVGLSEAGVRARLRNLQQQGVLRGSETWLNPSLFDASLVAAEIPIRDPNEVERLLRELSLVDGVTFARDILDEEDRKVQVYYVSDNPSATARRTSLLRRLSPAGQLRGPRPYWIPSCTRPPTPLDWRLLSAFRRRPEGTTAEFASDVGASLKTVAQRFHRLVDSNACWWTPSSASAEMPLALLSVSAREGADRGRVARSVARENPIWMPIAPDGFGTPPSASNAPIVGLVPADAPVALEQAIRRTLAIEGVSGVRRTFALGSSSYPAWFDEQLAGKLPARA